ncbi:MAG: hypothetical protein PHE49_08565 [bacterium]|nr:hypothetical protein [bacterium]
MYNKILSDGEMQAITGSSIRSAQFWICAGVGLLTGLITTNPAVGLGSAMICEDLVNADPLY